MGSKITNFIDQVTDLGQSLQPEHWAMLSIGVILVGIFCLKGMGIRNG